MTKDEALRLALEALENAEYGDYYKKELNEAITAIKEALAQPEHEPVAWMSKDADIVYTSIQVDGCFQHDHIPLYTTPPQRTWVGLTRMELIKCGVLPYGMSYELYEAIEAKLKSKNT